jgi:hypothetical protein
MSNVLIGFNTVYTIHYISLGGASHSVVKKKVTYLYI